MSDPSSERVGEISDPNQTPDHAPSAGSRSGSLRGGPELFCRPRLVVRNHSLGVTVRGKRRRIVIDEATVNPFAQLLYLAMINPKAGSMREVVHGPDARVYQEDWKANHPTSSLGCWSP